MWTRTVSSGIAKPAGKRSVVIGVYVPFAKSGRTRALWIGWTCAGTAVDAGAITSQQPCKTCHCASKTSHAAAVAPQGFMGMAEGILLRAKGFLPVANTSANDQEVPAQRALRAIRHLSPRQVERTLSGKMFSTWTRMTAPVALVESLLNLLIIATTGEDRRQVAPQDHWDMQAHKEEHHLVTL